MPFEPYTPIPAPTVNPATPDLSEPSRAGLLWLLRHPDLWPAGFKWYFPKCSCCAIALAENYWRGHGVYQSETSPRPSPRPVIMDLVSQRAYERALCFSNHYPVTDSLVTAEMVADQLEGIFALEAAGHVEPSLCSRRQQSPAFSEVPW